MLEKELKKYEDIKLDLVKKSNGKYVLIKGTDFTKIFESHNEAMNEGFKLFKSEPFLVKKIAEVEQIQNFISQIIME